MACKVYQEIQVYVVPRDSWILCRRFYRETITDEALNVGYVRVEPDMSVQNFRIEIFKHIASHLVPKEFHFVRQVRTIFKKIKLCQEAGLKVENLIPSFSRQPELYILEEVPNEKQDDMFIDAERNSIPLPPPATTLEVDQFMPPHICHAKCQHTLAKKRKQVEQELAETVQKRYDANAKREDLLQTANKLKYLILAKREVIEHRRQYWREIHSDYTSTGKSLCVSCNSLRSVLSGLHKKLMKQLESRDVPMVIKDVVATEAYYRLVASKLYYEIKELQQKARDSKFRLDGQIRLKEQAEKEVEELTNELKHKKIISIIANTPRFIAYVGMDTMPLPQSTSLQAEE